MRIAVVWFAGTMFFARIALLLFFQLEAFLDAFRFRSILNLVAKALFFLRHGVFLFVDNAAADCSFGRHFASFVSFL
jgi:hypothetical protein